MTHNKGKKPKLKTQPIMTLNVSKVLFIDILRI